MKFIHAKQFEILAALGSVAGVISRKSTLPVLSNVLIRRHGDIVEFVGTDLEAQMRTAVPIGGDQGDYAVAVNAKKVLDILRALPAEQIATLEDVGGKIVLKSGRSKFQLQSLPAEDMPLVTEAADFGPDIVVAQSAMRKIIDQCAFACAVNDLRYFLNGVLFSIKGNRLSVVATDGHRMAMTGITLTADARDQDVILPRKAVEKLRRLLKTGSGDVTMRLAGNQARFSFDGVEFITKLIDGKFPDYNRVLPKAHDKSLTLSRVELLGSIQRVSLLTSDKFRGIKLICAPGILSAEVANAGETANEEIVTEYAGDRVEIGMNVDYMLDVLTSMDQSMVTITMKDGTSAICVKRSDDADFVYVLMPMRL